MTNLGAFGAAVEEATLDPAKEKDTFTFFGTEFTVIGEFSPMLYFQMAALTSGKLPEADGAAAMWEALNASLGDQFSQFYRLAVDKKASLVSIMELTMTLWQGGTGFPTAQVPDSSAGPSPISPSSSTSSSTPQDSGAEVPEHLQHLPRGVDATHATNLVPFERTG